MPVQITERTIIQNKIMVQAKQKKDFLNKLINILGIIAWLLIIASIIVSFIRMII